MGFFHKIINKSDMVKSVFMSAGILKKLVLFLLTIFLSATSVFFISRLAPSDPVEIILAENATFEAKEQLRKELGIDRPLLVQYFTFLESIARFDFGRSISSKRKVSDEIKESFPETLKVATLSLFFSTIIAIFLGLWAAVYKDRFPDKLFGFLSSLMVVSPSFLLGPILLLFFAVKFPLFPIGGDESLMSYILPAFVLSVPFSGYSARVLRTSLIEEKSKPYFLTSLQKGLSYTEGFYKHLFPNAILPFIQIVGLHIGGLLTGAIIVEKIFRINGIGTLLVRSVFTRDYPLLTSLIILFSVIYLLGNLFSDFLSTLLDPRVR